jgi:squalene-hopene/tetraprenyl-beta-curcumene cyclase
MQAAPDLNVELEQTIHRATDWSVRNQHAGGHWVGFLETNCTMEAEWILGMHILGVKDDPKKEGVLQAIRKMQRPDGAWEVYHQAESGDMNATVECYAALRCSGAGPHEPHMIKAREWILSHGGVQSCRVFTKIWLAMVGEWPWDGTPTLPPEIVFFPLKFPFSLYNFASWARATIVPLCVISARRPVVPMPPGCSMDELFPKGRKGKVTKLPRPKGFGWAKFFWVADKALRAYQKYSPFKPFRENAIKNCLEWILSRQEADGCWAGIQPPWIYSLMALRFEGYPLDHPVLKAGIRCFDEPWAENNERGTFLQACTSPVWDTLLTQLAMLDCGLDCSSPAFLKSLEYILAQQITARGDWCYKLPNVQGGGWAFEYENDWYPDLDDTGVGLIVLSRALPSAPEHLKAPIKEALRRAEGWVRAMVCSNGAWAAFDKDNTEPLIKLIPFCDFGEAIDPPSVDVTAHIVEALGCLGHDMSDPQIARAVDYLRKEQEADGSWFGRWGVNHIYGTAAVLPALEKIGENMNSLYVVKAAEWLVSKQNEDGGWGETCASYMDESLRGVGPSTPSQTGWALMALLATGGYQDSIARGIRYLSSTQTADGSWDEAHYTGTGFPGYGGGARTNLKAGETLKQGRELSRGFMLRYHMYRHYFPLMALGRARDHFAPK